MKFLFYQPLCFLRGCWYTLRYGWPYWVSGHSYVEQPDTPPNVQVLKCENCGNVSVSWSWEPIQKVGDKSTWKQVNL